MTVKERILGTQARWVMGRVMAGVVSEKDGGAWLCRMCDLTACGRDTGHCPTANAAAEKYGADAIRRDPA